jgi:D-lyxose ketol-isomerase
MKRSEVNKCIRKVGLLPFTVRNGLSSKPAGKGYAEKSPAASHPYPSFDG